MILLLNRMIFLYNHLFREIIEATNYLMLFLISPDLILKKYSRISNFTSLDKIINPKIFGNAIAKIIMSEKSITAPKLTDEPITINIKKINL